MQRIRNFLPVAAVLSLVLTAGCQWLGLTAVVGGGYLADSDNMVQKYTALSAVDGAARVGDAVQLWRERDQLPMPVLAEGSHSFSITIAPGQVNVKGSRGARTVRLFDNGDAIADYVVAWDRTPYEYRLVSATNLLYDAPLDVADVPTLPTYNLR